MNNFKNCLWSIAFPQGETEKWCICVLNTMNACCVLSNCQEKKKLRSIPILTAFWNITSGNLEKKSQLISMNATNQFFKIMETIIVICLLVIIVLLVQDKIVIRKRTAQKLSEQKVNPNLPDIMGQPKAVRSLSLPNSAHESQIKKTELISDNFDIEDNENDNAAIQIPEEELDGVFTNMPDLEEEEEEWNRYGISGGNDGFAQGVTFEELSSAGMMLQKEKLEPSQKQTTAAIVQKIQGTELFILLENSMESASRKIAELLDGGLSFTVDSALHNSKKIDENNFDIGDFV
jgi:hypothetical protein